MKGDTMEVAIKSAIEKLCLLHRTELEELIFEEADDMGLLAAKVSSNILDAEPDFVSIEELDESELERDVA